VDPAGQPQAVGLVVHGPDGIGRVRAEARRLPGQEEVRLLVDPLASQLGAGGGEDGGQQVQALLRPRVRQGQLHEVGGAEALAQAPAPLDPLRRLGRARKVDAVPHSPQGDGDAGGAEVLFHRPGAGEQQGRLAGLQGGRALGPPGPHVVDRQHQRQPQRRNPRRVRPVEQVPVDQVGGEAGRDIRDAAQAGLPVAQLSQRDRIRRGGERRPPGLAQRHQAAPRARAGQLLRQVPGDPLRAAPLQAGHHLHDAQRRVVVNVQHRRVDDAVPAASELGPHGGDEVLARRETPGQGGSGGQLQVGAGHGR
jgi:hypothetical protein